MEPNMTKRIALYFGLLFASLPLVAGTGLPMDVERFIAKRESCDHFRGEVPPPGDKRRMREVSREVRKWCSGTDRTLVQLKKKYAKNAAITMRLDEFEPNIEPKRSSL